jgi:hypothetical protein
MGRPTIDIIGKTFNHLTCIERCGSTKKRHAVWKFRCVCGKEFLYPGFNVVTGKKKSCGCKTEIFTWATAVDRLTFYREKYVGKTLLGKLYVHDVKLTSEQGMRSVWLLVGCSLCGEKNWMSIPTLNLHKRKGAYRHFCEKRKWPQSDDPILKRFKDIWRSHTSIREAYGGDVGAFYKDHFNDLEVIARDGKYVDSSYLAGGRKDIKLVGIEAHFGMPIFVEVNGEVKNLSGWAKVLGVTRERARQLHAAGGLVNRIKKISPK